MYTMEIYNFKKKNFILVNLGKILTFAEIYFKIILGDEK
jgi:hypothetical protein